MVRAVTDRGNKAQRRLELLTQYAAERQRRAWSARCLGIVVIVFTYALAGAAVVSAFAFDMTDLYIVGGIFGAGAVMMTAVICIRFCSHDTELFGKEAVVV